MNKFLLGCPAESRAAMKSNEACGYIPPTPGYGPCTRDRGHEGPCAHELLSFSVFQDHDNPVCVEKGPSGIGGGSWIYVFSDGSRKCEIDMSASERKKAEGELLVSVRDITREFLDYDNFLPSEILFGKQWGDSPTIITDGDRVMGVMVPVPDGCNVSREYAKHIASLLFKRLTARFFPFK